MLIIPFSKSCFQKQIQHQPILIQQISLSVFEAHIYPELEVVSTPVITTDRTLIMDERAGKGDANSANLKVCVGRRPFHFASCLCGVADKSHTLKGIKTETRLKKEPRDNTRLGCNTKRSGSRSLQTGSVPCVTCISRRCTCRASNL